MILPVQENRDPCRQQYSCHRHPDSRILESAIPKALLTKFVAKMAKKHGNSFEASLKRPFTRRDVMKAEVSPGLQIEKLRHFCQRGVEPARILAAAAGVVGPSPTLAADHGRDGLDDFASLNLLRELR